MRSLRPWKGIAGHVLDEAGVTSANGLVHIPYRLPEGALHCTRVVAADGRRWWSPAGKPVMPFGLELLPGPVIARISILIVAEGESDTFALREACGVVGGVYVIGLPGAASWKHAWARCISDFPEIYVAGDGDPRGAEMIKRVIASVPWAIPVQLPDGEDARSLLQARGLDALVQLVDEAVDRALGRAELDRALRRSATLAAARASLVREVR